MKVESAAPSGGWIKFALFALVGVLCATLSAWVIYLLQVESLIVVSNHSSVTPPPFLFPLPPPPPFSIFFILKKSQWSCFHFIL